MVKANSSCSKDPFTAERDQGSANSSCIKYLLHASDRGSRQELDIPLDSEQPPTECPLLN